MLYNITTKEVVNELTPHPPFITEYTITDSNGDVFLRTHSEDKAKARHQQMTFVADMRDL